MENGLTLDRRNDAFVILAPGGEPLLEEAPLEGGASLSVTEARLRWYLVLSWWRFIRRLGRWRPAFRTAEDPGDGWVPLTGEGGNALLEWKAEVASPAVARGEVRVADGVPGDWLRWRLAVRPEERLLGFGERFNAVDQRGNKLYVWTEEGAVGLGEKLGKLLDGVSWNPFLNGPTTAYKPMPFFISSGGYGLLLETSARVEYDVAATDSDVLDITVWDRAFSWVLFYGPTPAEVVERFTEWTGRATVPAPWVFAPWNDAVYGSESVRTAARKLREEKIPTTALWSEDWQGGFWIPPINRKSAAYMIFPLRYKVDRILYPDAERVADDLHEQGFRWLSYFMPYILRNSREYREAKKKGYLLKNRRGGVCFVLISWYLYGQIDLTNPEAREWYMSLLEENVKTGFDGWMADFGEYVPPGAVASNGETGLIHHNKFPLLWQEVNRELFDRLRPDGDYVFFCRSAGVGSQKYAPVFWSGDSNTDFEKYDGLPSNLPAVISAGLCGLPLWAADIGGYMCLTTTGRDKEVFFRWTEFAALLPVMRTHHGTHPGRCWAYDSDRETLEHFRLYCRLHTALFPYIYGLAHEAARSGLPAVRHLVLEFPGDAESWGVENQFMLGDRLLVAPVIKRGATARSVYFPPGTWIDYWTGEEYGGPARRYVDAPLGRLPLYVMSGRAVATLDAPVDTLAAAAEGSGLVGLDEALSTLRVTLYGAGEDRVTLWDGTDVSVSGGPGRGMDRTSIDVAGGEPSDGVPAEGLQPEEKRSRPLLGVAVSGGVTEVVVTGDGGAKVAAASIGGGPPRDRVTFEWR